MNSSDNTNKNTALEVGVFSIILVFLGSFLYTSYHQTLAADDFYFASYLKNYGIWDSMQLERNQWNSRWTSLLLNFSLLKLNTKFSHTFLLYNLFNLGLSVYLFKSWSNRFTKWPNAFAGISAAILFWGTFSIGEVWFWSCSTTAYLTSTLLLAILHIRLAKQLSIKSGVLLAISVVYIGGSSMPIALIGLYLLGRRLIKQLKGNQENVQWIILFTLLLLISFLYLLNGEGSYKRQLNFEQLTLSQIPLFHLKLIAISLVKYILPQLGFLLIMGLPILFIPSNLPPIKASKLTGSVAFYVIQFGIALFIYQGIFTYITQDISAARSFFPINLLLVIYIIKTFILLHQYLKGKVKNQFLQILSVMIPFLFISYSSINKITKDNTYRKHFQEVVSELENEQALLNALPETGFIYPTKISVDSTYFSNQHLKLYFELTKTPVVNDTN